MHHTVLHLSVHHGDRQYYLCNYTVNSSSITQGGYFSSSPTCSPHFCPSSSFSAGWEAVKVARAALKMIINESLFCLETQFCQVNFFFLNKHAHTNTAFCISHICHLFRKKFCSLVYACVCVCAFPFVWLFFQLKVFSSENKMFQNDSLMNSVLHHIKIILFRCITLDIRVFAKSYTLIKAIK